MTTETANEPIESSRAAAPPFIRRAREQDAAEIARLSAQLGYAAGVDQMQHRLRALAVSTQAIVLVAEDPGGALAGWVHAFLSQLVESDLRVEIGGLIVDERCLRQGVGKDLVAHVERWAAERKVREISVRCRDNRAGAHLFYEQLGFNRSKTQIVFRKPLS